jgi:hypothetical protein
VPLAAEIYPLNLMQFVLSEEDDNQVTILCSYDDLKEILSLVIQGKDFLSVHR